MILSKSSSRILTIPLGERQFLSVGLSSAGRLLVVAYTERQQRIRLISAREATARERKNYESTIPKS